jgi:RNA recognition motif-containing protein
MKDRVTEKPRGFGFVTFKEQEAADRAFQDEHVLDGRTVSTPACHSTAVLLGPAQAGRAHGSELAVVRAAVTEGMLVFL